MDGEEMGDWQCQIKLFIVNIYFFGGMEILEITTSLK